MTALVDCHCHILNGGAGDAEDMCRRQRERYGCAASNFLSVEGMDDASQNALGIYCKLIDPAHYAFGGLHYRFAYDFGEEAERLWELGFDGIKMIENKPTERRRLGYRQDDPRYDSLYETAEALGIPLLIHVSDPAFNWDPLACPDWARAAGCYYGDGGYVSYERLLEETVHMLERRPQMNVCMAHLFFLSDNEPLLRSLMDRFPGLWLDITAGTEMYYNFTKQPALWRRFFLDYADRILFGTDNCYPMSETEQRIADEINALERDYLTRADRFPLWDRQICGAGLPPDAVRRIMGGNFRRFAGAAPRPLQRDKAAEYLRERLENRAFALTEQERQTTAYVLERLEDRPSA